ncbi:50S ribosomal protein L21 [Geodia barretti]|uniref:Large ribosomal subunit protein bL21m n=1 Tax=Geodia barretti TaxID=519541 RepID=A0AA35X6W1_GEOBA|nr:50S ribosomal protein L21 [Geodia barretti]
MVEIKGKQYRVRPGTEIVVDRLSEPETESLDLESVLLLADGTDIRVGDPYVAHARVRARVAGEERGKKLRVVTYRRRKRTQRDSGPSTAVHASGDRGRGPGRRQGCGDSLTGVLGLQADDPGEITFRHAGRARVRVGTRW